MPDTCFLPFFPRILIHFIDFHRAVGKGFGRRMLLKPSLEFVTPVQQVAVRQPQLARELTGALAQADAAQDQDPLAWHFVGLVQWRLRVEVKDTAAIAAAEIENRVAIAAVNAIIFSSASWTMQTAGMQELK
jgi:hypothetical protein